MKKKSSSINEPAKTKVENVLKAVSIIFNPNNETKNLKFTIAIGETSKTFTISGLNNINQKMMLK